MLNHEEIERIRAAVDLVTYIGQHVKLRQSGQSYAGCCPFHPDKTPSFYVSREKQVYHCFGCQARGDIFRFIQEREDVSFMQSVGLAAAYAGIRIAGNEEDLAKRQADLAIKSPLWHCLNAAAAYFTRLLSQEAGQKARHYLAQRKIAQAVCQRHRLGFGGTGPHFLEAMAKQGFNQTHCIAAGLLSEDGHHFLLQNRLIFPILATDGENIIGFGARALSAEQQPKYMHSRQTPVFTKKTVLYHAHRLRRAKQTNKTCVVVEGFLDALALEPLVSCIPVATLGTALTAEHARFLAKNSKRVVLFYDHDQAGQHSAFKAACLLMEADLNVAIAAAPSGEDPDSFARKYGVKAVLRAIQQAKVALRYFTDFFMQQISQAQTEPLSYDQWAEVLKQVAPLFQRTTTALDRELYCHHLSNQLGISVSAVVRLFEQAAQTDHNRSTSSEPPAKRPVRTPIMPDPRPNSPDSPALWEYQMLRELLLYGEQLRPRCAVLADKVITPAVAAFLKELTESAQSIELLVKSHIKDAFWQKKLLESSLKLQESLDEESVRAHRTYEDIVSMLEDRRIRTELQHVVSRLGRVETAEHDKENLLQYARELVRQKRGYHGRANQAAK